MLTSILNGSESTLSVQTAAICILAALVLGFAIAWVYSKSAERYSKNYIITLVLLPALVACIILMTSGSLGSAVAVAGAFSLVRFRSAQGTAREIIGIFFAMAVGLAVGVGQIFFAVMVTILISIVLFALNRSAFGGDPKTEKILRITIPEDLDYTSIFDDLFHEFTTVSDLESVKTVNLGSMYELRYRVILRDERQEKAMIDEIRVRNGNLTVVCARQSERTQEL